MELSLVVPLLNEADSLPELYRWIDQSLEGIDYELIFVDDGSTDHSWRTISLLSAQTGKVKGIQFSRNFGKSQALHAGFLQAKGEYVVTLDADLQDSPAEIISMITLLEENKWDLISGWKKKRYDSILFKNLPSRLFNWAARRVSGIQLHDFNCGIKVYRKDVIKEIEVYGEMHRYIPVLAAQAGFNRIGEKVVRHQARKHGVSKFGMERFIRGFLDLITLWFLHRFGKYPMHFFGLLGTLMLLLGFGFTLYLGIDKLFINQTSRLISERPEFYIALTTMILGSQFFIAGFLAELILKGQPNKERYIIKNTIAPHDH